MKSTSKFVPVEDVGRVTMAFLTRHIKARIKEIRNDKTFPFKVSLDINKWVVRAEPNGDITILTPKIK